MKETNWKSLYEEEEEGEEGGEGQDGVEGEEEKVYCFPRAAMTKNQNWVAENNRNLLSNSYGL